MSLLAPARGMSTLPAKGGFSRPSSIRSAGSHRGLSSRWSLAYSSCWDGFSFSTSCFTIPIHPIIIYMILSFVNSMRYLVDWKAATPAGIAWALRPHSERSERGGSSHARGKRPPAVEINSFSSYPKNTDLRTNIYFAPERLLGYTTDTSCTSRAQEPPTESVMYFRSG